MPNLPSYLDAYVQGLAVADARRKLERDQQLRNAFAQAYRPARTEEAQFAPSSTGGGEDYRFEGQGQMTAPARVVPGGLDLQALTQRLHQSGLGPEALQMEAQVANLDLETLLKRAQAAKAMKESQEFKAPTTREYPVGDGLVRTEEWNPRTGQWTKVAEGKKTPLVTVDNRGDDAFAKERGKQQAQAVTDAEGSAAVTQGLLDTVQQAKAILPQIRTGPGAGVESTIGSVMQWAGADPTNWGLSDPNQMQRFESLASQAVSQIRQVLKFPASGFSDADRQMLERAVAGLGKNPQANMEILLAAEKIAQRELQRVQAMTQWADKNGSLKGFNEHWLRHQKDNPLFTQNQPTQAHRNPQTKRPYAIGDLVTGRDGRRYAVKTLKPDGSPDDVEPVQ